MGILWHTTKCYFLHSIAARSSQLCFIPSEVIKAIKNRFPTVQNRLVTILGEQLLESWKSNSKFISNVADIETKKNPLKSLKVKSMALFGASPTPDMQLSRFAAELASGLFLRLRRFYEVQPSWFYFLLLLSGISVKLFFF